MSEELVNSSKLVSLKNNLKKDKIENDITNLIVEKILSLNLFQKYRFDNELIKYVCNLIEHLVKKEWKIDKKQLAIKVMKKVFDLNHLEVETISNMIEFLWNNNQIKKQKMTKYITRGVGDWFKKGLMSFLKLSSKKLITTIITDKIITPLLISKFGLKAEVVIILILAFI